MLALVPTGCRQHGCHGSLGDPAALLFIHGIPLPCGYPMCGMAGKTGLARNPALSNTKGDKKSQRVTEGSVHPPDPQLIPSAAFRSAGVQLYTSCLPEMPALCTHLHHTR